MKDNRARRRKSAAGFTLMEVLIAIVVLTIALMGLLSALGFAMAATHGSQQDLIAKQLATEAMESIFTARNTAQVQWLQIQNIGAGTNPDGIFLTGPQAINQAGPDGILGTADDAGAGPVILAGPDGVVGTADDITLNNFSRTIAITPVANTPALRTISVTITYSVPPLHTIKNYSMTGFISQYR
ncbi:MAG: type IV pilus modification PilV family protein [Actinomycetota bacterium]